MARVWPGAIVGILRRSCGHARSGASGQCHRDSHADGIENCPLIGKKSSKPIDHQALEIGRRDAAAALHGPWLTR